MRLSVLVVACIWVLSEGAAASQAPARPSFKPLRFDEDWRAWCASQPGSQTEPLKCISFGDAYLSFGSDLRERIEVVHNPGFGLGPSDDQAFLHRAMIHADLRIGPALRIFTQIGAFGYNGRVNGPAPADSEVIPAAVPI